ncbi:hypothetical protein N0V84_008851 [Fusarium piperis]|uniref:Uncharacterized protein n=1 Tax=Fusarium piperis TaxID=1435070 RepID=A0A9W8W7H6_9HYPO|nr:hypothetical protein N0V84_008851 [Fusarium piperis]
MWPILSAEQQYEKASNVLIGPALSDDSDGHFDFNFRRWDSSFRQVNATEWLIFDKIKLTQLPLENEEQEDGDYVDHKEGFIYRIKELEDHEERPTNTTSIPLEGPVRPRRAISYSMNFCYLIGSSGSLNFMPAKADENHPNHHAWAHENIEYVEKKGPEHFRTPRVIYHTEFEGKYAIMTETFGTPILERPFPVKFLNRLLDQIAKAVGEMAQWEESEVQGVGKKDIQWYMFEWVPSTIFVKGKRASGYVQKYLKKKGFDMEPCGFLNAHMRLCDISLDEDYNLVGFDNWMECAFVPKGYITSYVLDRVDHTAPPCDLKWDLRELILGLRRQGTARLTKSLANEGLPNQSECFMEVLLDDNALRATYMQHWQLCIPRWSTSFLFPDNNRHFRPEVFPNE